jgi:hypothetical protein
MSLSQCKPARSPRGHGNGNQLHQAPEDSAWRAYSGICPQRRSLQFSVWGRASCSDARRLSLDSQYGGLFRFDAVRFERIDAIHGQRLPSTSVAALWAPPSGGLWVGYQNRP